MDAVRKWDGAVAARATRAPARRTLVKVQAAVLALACAAAVCVLGSERAATVAQAQRAAVGLTSALAAHIDDLVTLYGVDLKSVADAIDAAGGDGVPPAMRQAIASSGRAHAKALRLIAVLNSKGDLVFESIAPNLRQASFADRDYFQAQAKAPAGLFISRPFIGRLDGELEIALSRRVTHRDGSFAGVVFGVIKLSLLNELFDRTPTGPGGSLSLMRADGIVLMRKPYRDGYIGRDLGSSDLFQLVKSSPSGLVDGPASIDGIDRLYAFSRVGELPLILSVGAARADISDGVDRRTVLMGLLVLLLAGDALVLAAVVGRGPAIAPTGLR